MSAVAYGRNARLGGGVLPSPFAVLGDFLECRLLWWFLNGFF